MDSKCECGYGRYKHLFRERFSPKLNRQQKKAMQQQDATIPSTRDIMQAAPGSRFTQVDIHSAYLGVVSLPALQMGPTIYALLSIAPGSPDVYVKTISATLNNLDIMNPQKSYSWKDLAACRATLVDVNDHKSLAEVAYPLREREQKGETLSDVEQKTLRDACSKLHVVDIHFAAHNYIEFLHHFGKNNVNDTPMLISVHDPKEDGKDVENAFFMGSCMVVGNGVRKFRGLGTLDILGHEITHALANNLAYKGHSGAMNESCADAGGTTFEFYMYSKYPNLQGKPDWLMGEDNTVGMNEYLRNMADPKKKNQPASYRGENWRSPSEEFDQGNVHTNSGVGNFLFYNLATLKSPKTTIQEDIMQSFELILGVYQSLANFANYCDLRDALIRKKPTDDVRAALKACGLTDDVVTDWFPSGASKRPRAQKSVAEKSTKPAAAASRKRRPVTKKTPPKKAKTESEEDTEIEKDSEKDSEKEEEPEKPAFTFKTPKTPKTPKTSQKKEESSKSDSDD